MMTYKGYAAKVEFDDDAMIFHGEVIGVRDVITFQGESVREIEQAFRDSVEDYLEFCKERGEKPDKAFGGKFVVRLTPELHRKIYIAAHRAGASINTWLNENLKQLLSQ